MNRDQLEHIIRAAAANANVRDIVVIILRRGVTTVAALDASPSVAGVSPWFLRGT